MTSIFNKLRHAGKSRQRVLCCLLVFFFAGTPVRAQSKLSQDDQALFGKAQSLNNLQRFKDAVEILRPLHGAFPNDTSIALELAKALGYSGSGQEAVEIMNRLIAQQPQEPMLTRDLASILEANNRFQESREQVLKLYNANPQDQALLQKLADLSMWMHDYESAVHYTQKLLAADKASAPLSVQLADAYFYSANYREAVRLYAQANITAQSHEAAYRNLAYSYFSLKDYDASLKAYQELAQYYPDDIEIKAALASVLYASGRTAEAEKYFYEMIAADPQDVVAMLKLAEILSLRKEYARAVAVYENILKAKPGQKEAQLGLARVLSWDKQYDRSLQIYAQIIQEDPSWVSALRERARLLGWRRHYRDSMNAYRAIPKDSDERESVEAEMKAKDLMYHRFDAAAIKAYEKWLSLEPENLEALFDLGQLYARNEQWANAKRIYGKILALLPEHQNTQQGQRKIQLRSASVLVESEYEFYEADSASRSTDVRYNSLKAGAKMPLSERFKLDINEKTTFYDFSRSPTDVTRQRITGVLEYTHLPQLEARVGYAFNVYSDDLDESHNFFEQIKFTPFGATHVTLGHERRDIIDNAATLTAGLYTDDYLVRVDHKPGRRIHAGADYLFSNLSDGNERDTFGVDLHTLIFYEPRRLSLIYRYENYGYEDPSAMYFSPGSFHINHIGFEWEHYLNKEELFWGSNDTFYTFRYLVNVDDGGQRGHKLFLGFQHDINERSFLRLEASKTIYEHQKIYSEDRISAHAGIHF